MRPAITVLLRLYPSEFRDAYGPLIELQARDELRSARGPFTAVRIIADMILGAAARTRVRVPGGPAGPSRAVNTSSLRMLAGRLAANEPAAE